MAFEHDRFAGQTAIAHVEWSNAATAQRLPEFDHESELQRAIVTLERASAGNADRLDALCRQLATAQSRDLDDDLLSETNQAVEQLRACAEELRDQSETVHKAFTVAERSFAGRKPQSSRLGAALRRGSKLLARLKATQGRYWLIEAELAKGEMLETEFHCNQQLRKISELEERMASIEQERDKLDRLGNRIFRRASTRQKRQHLEQRRKSVCRRLGNESIEIDDMDLQRWLGVLLGASLHSDRDTWWQRTQRARELWYRLVSTRSWQLATSLRSRNAARLQWGSDEITELDRRGQRFISSAFAQQREQLRMQSESVARDRIARMEEVRASMAAEYREFVGQLV